MSSKPMISVVMSVYNGEPYLSEAIESILQQTYSDFEFVIINDGSTDNSLSIIKSFQEKDERIVLVSRENKGLIASLNEGIELAKGKYIARMDADDISQPTRFEQQVDFMEKNEAVVVCGTWIEQIYIDGRKPKLTKYYTSSKEIKTQLLFSCPFAHPSVFIRKSTLITNNIRYNNKFVHAEDYYLWTELSRFGEFANLNKALLRYRYLEDSITRVADKQRERQQTLERIYANALNGVGFEASQNELSLIYHISNNARLGSSNININELLTLLDKLYNRLRYNELINIKLIKYLLSKRLVWIFLLKKDVKVIKSIWFWLGVKNVLEDKLINNLLSVK